MPAATAGVQVGDVIVSADGNTIESAGDLIEALEDTEGTTIEIEVIRDRRPLRIEAEIPEPDDEAPTGPRA
jgi:S1-C subfamily serine protease